MFGTVRERCAWLAALVLALAGCGDDDGPPESLDGSISDADVTPGDAASGMRDAGSTCSFEGEREHPHDSEPAMHVASPPEPGTYNSNPPSSGPHCGVWGQYATYTGDAPLPACNFIHNLEHGAIALLYHCPEECPEIVAALESLRDAPPDDPDCPTPRILLTPYPELDVRVAAAAWGYTWKADCLDETARASLREFIHARWGSRGDSPEPTVCSGGSISP